MPPIVVWSRRAERLLGTALGRTVYSAGESHTGPLAERAAISARLARAFAEFGEIVVLNHFVGFRHRPGEHILQVDVRRVSEKIYDRTTATETLKAILLLGYRIGEPGAGG